MSTTTTWPGGATDASPTAYTVPASGELNWSSLSAFLNVLATSAQSTTAQKWGMRVATTTPVTVSATADCVVATKLAAPGAVAVNLPAGANKQVFVIVDQTGDAATNNITITPNGAETINGSATLVLSTNREAVVLVYSTTNTRWNVVARYVAGTILTNPMVTAGDMIYGGASGVSTKLATGATTGLLHGGNAATPTWSQVVDADVSASAAIAGSKLVAAASSVAGAVSATTQTMTGIKTFETQLIGKGTATNDSAAAGYIGEYIANNRSTDLNVSTIASGDAFDIDTGATVSGGATTGATGIALTAGDWDIAGEVYVETSGSTVTIIRGFVGTGTGNNVNGRDISSNMACINAAFVNGGHALALPTYRVSLSGSTTYYLKCQISYSVAGTIVVRGNIRARRVR